MKYLFDAMKLLLIVFVLGLVGCTAQPCAPSVDDSSSNDAATKEEKPLSYYNFFAPHPGNGYCEQQVFGAQKMIAEPVNFVFCFTAILIGLFAIMRSRRTTMAFQFLYSFLTAWGLFSATYHVTLNNGMYRMMDVSGSFLQAFILVMFIHSLYLYRVKVTETKTDRRRYRYITNILTLVFTMYPAIVHVAGESSANPWVAWLVFDLLWFVILAMLIMIWRRRKTWPGVTPDARVFKLVWYSIATCALAYIGWCIDKFLCTCETPVLAYLQLHGWWHFFMALCFYYMITLNRYFSAHEYNYHPVLKRFPANAKFALTYVEWEIEAPADTDK